MFFTSPESSVETITQLLLSEDWETLSSYYHVDENDHALIDSLHSGDYFIRKERPAVAHPGGFWKYKHPFSPGYSYSSHSTIERDLVIVNLVIEIDQGDNLIQEGYDSFLLKIFNRGYKILPGRPGEELPIRNDK